MRCFFLSSTSLVIIFILLIIPPRKVCLAYRWPRFHGPSSFPSTSSSCPTALSHFTAHTMTAAARHGLPLPHPPHPSSPHHLSAPFRATIARLPIGRRLHSLEEGDPASVVLLKVSSLCVCRVLPCPLVQL